LFLSYHRNHHHHNHHITGDKADMVLEELRQFARMEDLDAADSKDNSATLNPYAFEVGRRGFMTSLLIINYDLGM